MRIAEYYSHFNGLEFILIQKPDIWEEIETVISSVHAGEYTIKINNNSENKSNIQYSNIDVINNFSRFFLKHGWKKLQEKNYYNEPDRSINSLQQTDFVKDRIAIEIQFGRQFSTPQYVFTTPLAFYICDYIDVGIEVLPTKALQEEMSSGVSYYEGELYNVVRQGRGVPAVPLVLVGIEP